MGFEGMRERAHWPDNSQSFYPMTKLASKHDKAVGELELSAEWLHFLAQYDKVVLIAFGTTFMPSLEDMTKIADAVALADPSIGFIISLKETTEAYKMISQRN